MGYSNKFNTRAATYQVAINSLKHLPDTKLDAAFGLSGLAFLYFTRWLFNRLERKAQNPIIRRAAFFANCLRIGITIIILTAVSYGINKNLTSKTYRIKINKTVPSGFRHMGVPRFDSNLISLMASEIPVSVIVLLLEVCRARSPPLVPHADNPLASRAAHRHLEIVRSRQQLQDRALARAHRDGSHQVSLVLVVADAERPLTCPPLFSVVGSFFGAYPATGSFSRSAIKSRAGVRTPLAGWWTGACVILALYALTDGQSIFPLGETRAIRRLTRSTLRAAFYWIPSAALSAVIIEAVGGLIASPRQTYSYWLVSPLECVIFLAAVLITFFTTIEIGIYVSRLSSAPVPPSLPNVG